MNIHNAWWNVYPAVRRIKPKYDCIDDFPIDLGPMAYDYVDDFRMQKEMG